MQVTMFKGLLPVNFPDAWFANPSAIRLGRLGQKQIIDFRPIGGKAFAFWVDSDRDIGEVRQCYEELEDQSEVDWEAGPWAIQHRRTVEMFGQSGTSLDLTHLA